MGDDTTQPHEEFSVAGDATARVILPPLAAWTGASERHIAVPSDPWITKAEQSDFRETADLAETRSWLESFAANHDFISLQSIGTSAGGRDIPMLIASSVGLDPAALRASGKAVVLIQAGMHAGEIDGKDATLMLLRNLAAGTLGDLLERTVLLFVPVLNVDGFSRFGPYARMNQRGPRQVSRHTNDQNLNLNRDFGKLDAPETRALVAVLERWAPELYVDTHVTDGVDYQYDVTFGHTAGRHGWSPEISGWLDEHLLPDSFAALSKEGHTPGPLILAVNDHDLRDGRFDFCANARFATGYASLRHIPAILIENHSLKTYRRRLLGLYALLRTLCTRSTGRSHARRQRRAAPRF
jgi:murein tripeptide amidase MpaA